MRSSGTTWRAGFPLSLLFSCLFIELKAQDSDDSSILNPRFDQLQSTPTSIEISNDGDIEFDTDQQSIIYHDNIVITTDNGITLKANTAKVKHEAETAQLIGNASVLQKPSLQVDGRLAGGLQIFSDTIFLDVRAKTITMDGNVSIYQDSQLHRGDHAVYEYEKKNLNTSGLASGVGPILLESDHFRLVDRNGKKVFIGENAGITTHDVAKPNYWIRSDKTTIYPDDKITFKNLRFYANDTPIFWLPYLSQPLDAELGYHFLPGSSSSLGPFLRNRYGMMLGGELDEETGERENAWLLSQWHFDILSKRGLGLGFDLDDSRLSKDDAFTGLKTYYLNDQDPTYTRSSIERDSINENRWKFELKYQYSLAESDTSKTSLLFNINALSDRYFLEDFETDTYRLDPNPDNEIGIVHSNPNYLAGIYTRLRLNDFYQTDTRLPELFFDQIKRPLLGSRILHEGQTTLGIYRESLADFYENELREESATLSLGSDRLNTINALLEDKGYTRFHTWHELSLPLVHQGVFSLVPHAGAGYTRYDSLKDGSDSFSRTHFSLGLDAAVKFSRAYPDLINERWGINGLLHIVQPYVNLSQFATDELDSSFNGIDTFIASTRPRPLEVGRFTAIDALTDWSIARLGVKNNLLTRRNNGTHSWLTLNTYLDVFFNDPEFDRDISNLYNDLSWQPLPWMRLNLETQFPIASDESDFHEYTGNITFMPSRSTEIALGYRELANHPTLEDQQLVTLSAYKRITEAWGIGMYQRWDLDENNIESQQYNIYHNFDSWTASMGIYTFDRGSQNEYGFMLNFTLREFPSINLPFQGSAQ
ncbi:MAG: LPS-assembly protein LptD [Akkermansiaceae bacterium]